MVQRKPETEGGKAKEGDRNRDRILGLKHLLYEV